VKARDLVLLTLLLLSGCVSLHVVEGPSDSSAIRALIQTYEAAVNRRDVEAAVATYSPDADS
jgi:hypothetical protein